MSDLPKGLEKFLSDAGWEGALIEPIPGDASFRRYFRIRRQNGETAMLMHAPPPHEDPKPFVHVAKWLLDKGLRAPRIISEDPAEGWLLLEDFGNERMREWVDACPQDEASAYCEAIDALIDVQACGPGPFPPYDMATYLREAALLTEWYCPTIRLKVDDQGYLDAWREVLGPLIKRQGDGVTVLRDYHAENIMLLGKPGSGEAQGLIDFQDALVGHPAYDLVSLLQDGRRDVSAELEAAMLTRFCEKAAVGANFAADYAILGAQRNAKIVGIFTRLYKRDGKPRYLSMIPRVWAAMERDLAHPALEPVADWFAANIPRNLRESGGGTIA